MNTLDGHTCSLRKVQPSDREIITRWENNPEFWPVTETPGPFSTDDIMAFISSCRDLVLDGQERWMILSLSGRILGCVDLFDYDAVSESAGVGILVAEEQDRGQGIASEALSVLIQHLRGRPYLKKLTCLIFPDNTPSIRLFTRTGFKPGMEVTFKGKKTLEFEFILREGV